MQMMKNGFQAIKNLSDQKGAKGQSKTLSAMRAMRKGTKCSIDFHTGRLSTGTTESSAVTFDCVFKTEVIANSIDHGPSEMSGFQGGFLTARCLNAIETAPYGRLSVEIEVSESGETCLKEISWSRI